MSNCKFKKRKMKENLFEFSLLHAKINKEYEIIEIDKKFEKFENEIEKNLKDKNKKTKIVKDKRGKRNKKNLHNLDDTMPETFLQNFHFLKILRRLTELGMVRNEKITLLRKSFLNETFLIKIKGYALLIDSELARRILIK